jgi:hypothetical protein
MLTDGFGLWAGETPQNVEIIGESPAVKHLNGSNVSYSPPAPGQAATAWMVEVRIHPTSTGSIDVYATCVK